MDVSYILEVVVGGKVDRAIALPLVGALTWDRIPTGTVTWTLGKKPLKEHAGVREFAVTLSGDSGMAFRHGYDSKGQRLFADGPELFYQFDKFLSDYAKTAHEHQQSGASIKHPVTLVLRALWEEKAIEVEERKFTWERAVELGPFKYRWSLDLQGYGVADVPASGDIFQRQLGFNPLKAAARTVDAATSYASVATEHLELIRGTLDTVREPIKAAGRMATEASKLATAGQSIRNWPHDLVADLFTTLTASTTAVFDEWAAAPLIDRQSVRSRMIDVLGPMAELRREALTWLGLNFVDVRGLEDPSATSASYRSTFSSRVATARPSVPYKLFEGQSIGDIAQDVTGDRSKWPEVAQLNSSADPHTTAEGRPLGPGETAMVPSPTGATQSTSNPADVYGTDLRLGPDGDLVLEGTTDISLVSGRANLQQALTLRAITVQGENAVFPTIGLSATVGEGIFAETAGLLASQARSQFGADSRIEEVSELSVSDAEGDRLSISALLLPVADTAFRVNIPVSQVA
jgi:hypothetical protein